MIEGCFSLIIKLRVVVAKKVFPVATVAFLSCTTPFAVLAQDPVATPSANSSTGQPSNTVLSGGDGYRIGPGDQVSIAIFGKPQLSRDERVDERGMIRMPLIDEDILASCRTENELAGVISRLYRERQLLKNPVVSVSVKDFQSQPVAVMGAVVSPGRFLLRRRVRLLELLVFHAGGPSEGKAGRKVQVLSTMAAVCEEGGASIAASQPPSATAAENDGSYDLKEMLAGNAAMNPYVRPGDIIYVAPAEQVLVVGLVARPSAVPLLEPTTLGRVLATVGGVLMDAKKDKIRIIRQVPGNSTGTTEFTVDLRDKDKSKGEGFLLQGGDIVEVGPKTGLAAFWGNLQRSLIPSLTNLPTRVVY